MIESKISDRILKEIESGCNNNDSLLKFINSLMINESEHAASWQWKETYKRTLESYVKKDGE